MHWPLAIVQLFFTLGWTVYVIFLPGLLKRAGIEASWLPWILIADQLIFAAADLAMGIWLDRSLQLFRRLGNWLTASVLVSCVVFASLPLLADYLPAWLFVPALFVWVLASSVLRVPPLVMLSKFAAPHEPNSMSLPVGSYLFGLGVAGALAPYVTVVLKNRDPMLPFVIASIALALAAVLLRAQLASRANEVVAVPPTPTATTIPMALPLLFAVAFFAFGIQIHGAVNSAKLFLRAAPGVGLEWLMPLFWAGFSVVMLPTSIWLARARDGAAATARLAIWLGGLVGGGALLATALAPSLALLVTLQIAAGAAWGVVFLAALSLAAALGKSGREGGLIGAMLALMALAAVARIALVLLLAPGGGGGSTDIAAMLPWATGAAWLLAVSVLWLGTERRH